MTYFRLKQGLLNKNYLTEVPANKKKNCSRLYIDNQLNCVKPLTIYDSLAPCIDSDKYDSDAKFSSLLGKDNVTPSIAKKVKYSTDHKVLDKKPLAMIPKDNPCEQDSKQMPPKKYLVMEPQNDEFSINEKEKAILPTKRCSVLKSKNEGPLEVKTEPELVTKFLAQITKYECKSNDAKEYWPIDRKDLEKENCCEKEISEFDTIKSRIKLDYSNFGLVLCFTSKMFK